MLNLRILLVMDLGEAADEVRALLPNVTGVYLQIEQSESVEEAETLLARGGHGIVLLDVPGRDRSSDRLQRIMRAAPHATIIALTTDDDEEFGRWLIEQGAQDYLPKGRLDRQLLGRALRHARERQRAERARDASESRFKTLFDLANIGMCLLDKKGRISTANLALEAVLGFPVNSLYGATLEDLLQPGQVLPRRSFRNVELRFRNPGGKEIWGLVALSWFEDGADATHSGLVIIHDVTEKKKLEREFLQAQKMEAIGKLAGGIAHDFNNILSVITASVAFAMEAIGTDSPAGSDLAAILDASDRAAALTRQLLSFSSRRTLRPRVVDLNERIRGLETMLGRVLGEDIELQTELDQRAPAVRLDPVSWEQVLVNLAVNAREAMPRGGRLRIQTETVREDGRDLARISITDNGSGMDAEVRDRIFEPFFTTKELGRGTGLGLSTCHAIITQAEGSISVESEPQHGTTFRIHLPVSVGERIVHITPTELPAPFGGSETILLVEDEEALLRLSERYLKRLGYKVVAATSGLTALDLCQDLDGPIDLLLTDVVMPQMSGKELAELVARFWPEIKVLYMSGYAANVLARHGVQDDPVSLLEKPFAPNDLIRKVRQTLDAA